MLANVANYVDKAANSMHWKKNKNSKTFLKKLCKLYMGKANLTKSINWNKISQET